jgi:hypothetical protein
MIGLAAGAAGLVGLGAAAAGFITEAAESAKIARLTEAAVRSTGGAAKISADQIGELAESLSNKTAIDDEAIQSASNLLLTFTNIRNEAGAGNDIFNQATEAALNMSTAMGTDANAAAMQLGKALNDPIKGVAALGKAGVQFTKDQKEQIKTLVESGRTMEAQQMILGELNTQFGGAAAAAADPMARLQVIAGNLGERIGGALLPHAEAFATWMADKGVPYAERLIEQLETHLPPAIDAVKTGFLTAKDVLQNDVFPTLRAIGTWIAENQTTLTVFAGIVSGVLAAAFTVWATRATIAAAQNTVAWFTTAAAGRAGAAGTRLSALQVVASWVMMGARATAQGLRIAAVWSAHVVAAAVRGAAGMAAAAARYAASWAMMGARAVAQGARIAAVWTAQLVAAAARGVASMAAAAARYAARWVFMGAQALVQAARMAAAWFIALGPIGWVGAAIIGLVALVVANWDKVKAFTIRAWNAISDKVKAAFQAVKTAVSAGIGAVVAFVSSLPGKILSALGNLGSLLLGAGRSVIDGFLDGIRNAFGKVRSLLGNLTDMLPDWKGPASRDKSVLFNSGTLVMRGFEDGLRAKFGDVRSTLGGFTDSLSAAAAVDVTGSAAPGGAGLGYSAPRYDVPAAGAAAGGGGAARVVHVSGVVGPAEVAALVRREQVRDEFLAGAAL